MNTKKALQYIGIAFVVFYLLKDPTNAAHNVNNLMGKLGDAGDNVGRFVNQLGK